LTGVWSAVHAGMSAKAGRSHFPGPKAAPVFERNMVSVSNNHKKPLFAW